MLIRSAFCRNEAFSLMSSRLWRAGDECVIRYCTFIKQHFFLIHKCSCNMLDAVTQFFMEPVNKLETIRSFSVRRLEFSLVLCCVFCVYARRRQSPSIIWWRRFIACCVVFNINAGLSSVLRSPIRDVVFVLLWYGLFILGHMINIRYNMLHRSYSSSY